MLADFCIPRLSNDMKIVVTENHSGGLISYRSLDPSKKSRVYANVGEISRKRSFWGKKRLDKLAIYGH